VNYEKKLLTFVLIVEVQMCNQHHLIMEGILLCWELLLINDLHTIATKTVIKFMEILILQVNVGGLIAIYHPLENVVNNKQLQFMSTKINLLTINLCVAVVVQFKHYKSLN